MSWKNTEKITESDFLLNISFSPGDGAAAGHPFFVYGLQARSRVPA